MLNKREPLFYKDQQVKQFYCDYLVDDKVIVEIKAIKEIMEIELRRAIIEAKLRQTKH